jgi:hypothetical protein
VLCTTGLDTVEREKSLSSSGNGTLGVKSRSQSDLSMYLIYVIILYVIYNYI